MIAQTHIQLQREPRVSAVESASGKVTVTIADGLDGAVSIEVQRQHADTFGDKVVQAICEARKTREDTVRFYLSSEHDKWLDLEPPESTRR